MVKAHKQAPYLGLCQPFPNLRVLNPNIKFFINNGVTGIYEEANYFSKGGELAELRSYIMAKCLWDTNTDVNKVIKEFTDAYYGAAAPMIRAYINDLHNTVCDKNNSHVRIWTPAAQFLHYPDKLAQWEDMFLKAEAAVADNATLLHRVKVAHVGIQYASLSLGGALLKVEGGKLIPQVKVDQKTAEAIYDTIKAEGITHVREGANGSAESWARGATVRNSALDLKTLRNNLKTKVEAARLLVRSAAWKKDNGIPYSADAAMAKLFAAETAMEVTTKAVQFHGGYGYTREYPVERMMRDAKITEIYEGTSEVQRMVIAGHLFK